MNRKTTFAFSHLSLKYFTAAICLVIVLLPQENIYAQRYPIIPAPASIQKKSGFFTWNNGVKINATKGIMDNEVEFLKAAFQTNKYAKQEKSTNVVTLLLVDTFKYAEGYRLNINPNDIQIIARTNQGLFYGIQSLLQLASEGVYLPAKKRRITKWKIPCVAILDTPRFTYRGMHLDVARHFYSVAFVKKYIDLLAMHKFNYFHWHLTDDQGWRIEIKAFPKLTKKGAYRDSTLKGHFNDQPARYDNQKYGGFYTQKEIKDVVSYAQKRHVTIIPEIEMPGHALAALASYRKLGCAAGPFKTSKTWGVFDDVFCTKDSTFYFLESVLTEVAALFPGPYIHIGGDECPKTRWKECPDCQANITKYGLANEDQLQSWFMKKIETFLATKGKKIIGWDEILDGGISKTATVMSYRGTEGGIKAASKGNDVIMTPASHCYFDYYQNESPDEPLAIGGFLPLEKVYNYDPIPQGLTTSDTNHILGCQGNVWTEYLRDSKKVEYMVFPRACALAEVAWSPKAKDYKQFLDRLAIHMDRLTQLKVNAATHFTGIQGKTMPNPGGGLLLELSAYKKGYKILYTLDEKVPNKKSPKYSKPIPITKNTTITAGMVKSKRPVGQLWKRKFDITQTSGAAITLLSEPHENYSLGTKSALVNGIKGNPQRYGDNEWLGWLGQNVDATIEFSIPKTITRFRTHFYQAPGQWIYPPKRVSIYQKVGDSYQLVSEKEVAAGTENYVAFDMEFTPITSENIKIIIQRHGKIARLLPGEGKEAWLFVDELELE